MIRNRAACAHLLGLCCFLPPVLAAFPGALSLLLLLASACFLPSRPCSHLAFTARVSACVCFFVLFVLLFWPFVVFCLVLLVLSSCCVDVFLCCAWCQLTEVTKDCRVLPAPSSHTHTPANGLPPSPRVSFGGWLVLEFVCWFVCLGCPVALSLWHVCLVL